MARPIRKALSLLLGILMLTFGVLKFFQPFHGWFAVQIQQSHQMAVATYVHLQPQVPASVLPLGLKPPVIPLAVLSLAVIAAIAVWKEGHLRVARDSTT